DLDGIALGLVAVGALMLLAKGLGEPGNRVRATRAGAERYRELVGLSLVLEVGAPLDLHMAPVALGTQERLRLALQRGGWRRDRVGRGRPTAAGRCARGGAPPRPRGDRRRSTRRERGARGRWRSRATAPSPRRRAGRCRRRR